MFYKSEVKNSAFKVADKEHNVHLGVDFQKVEVRHLHASFCADFTYTVRAHLHCAEKSTLPVNLLGFALVGLV